MANSQLIQGAGKVARAKVAGGTVGSRAATETARFLAEGTGKVIQRRNREFNNIMNAQLNQEGLTDEEYQLTYERLKRMRVGYVYLNKKDRMDLERKIIDDGNNKKKLDDDKEVVIDNIKDKDIKPDNLPDAIVNFVGRPDFAATQDELVQFVKEDEDGNNVIASYRVAWTDGRFKVSNDGKTKTATIGDSTVSFPNTEEGYKKFVRDSKLYWIQEAEANGNKILHYDSQTGKREYLTPEEARALLDDNSELTTDDLKQYIQGRNQAEDQSQVILDNVSSGSVKAKALKEGEPVEFNSEEARNRYSKIITSDNALDLAMSKQIGETSFKQDLEEKITTMKYSDLGISEDIINNLDPTDDGKVSKSDAKVITGKILQDDEMLKEYLAEYFTLYEKREFEANVPTNLRSQLQGEDDDEDEFVDKKEGGDDKKDDKEKEVYKPNLSQQQTQALSTLSVTGKGAILENGSAITMKNVPTGLAFPKTADINGVNVSGTKIIANTSFGDQEFGEFVKSGNNYKWEASDKNMKLFNDNATKEQRASFNEFIKLIESDPEYAAALLNHTQGGKGTINAATLDIK
jgi:hypothetical protein